MNNRRRTKLRAVISELGSTREKISLLREEEDESRYNMPESLQETDRYRHSEECSYAMDDAIESINSAISEIGEVI